MNITARDVLLRVGLGMMLFGAGTLTTWATWDTCPVPTISSSSATCLTYYVTNENQSLSIINECGNLGRLAAQISYNNMGDDGDYEDITYVDESHGSTVSGEASFGAVRCCPTNGLCQRTDCDTTYGLINESFFSQFCEDIDNYTHKVKNEGMEITNGEIHWTTTMEEQKERDQWWEENGGF